MYWSVHSSLKSLFSGSTFLIFEQAIFSFQIALPVNKKIWLAIFWLTRLRTCRDRRREGGCMIFALWRSLLFAVFMLYYRLFCLWICISVRNNFTNIIMLCIVKSKKKHFFFIIIILNWSWVRIGPSFGPDPDRGPPFGDAWSILSGAIYERTAARVGA
jgi:hypothetical protein